MVAAVKFNIYWCSRRLQNYPMAPEMIQRKFNDLFVTKKLKVNPKSDPINRKLLLSSTVGVQDHAKGSQMIEIDPDKRRELFKNAQVKFNIAMDQNAKHKSITYDEVISKVWLKTGCIKSYAATYKVLTELKQNGFIPRNMLDFGCGAGTGLWAANDLFKDQMYEYTGVDNSLDQLRMARFIVTGGHPDVETPGIRFKKNIPEGMAFTREQYSLGQTLTKLR